MRQIDSSELGSTPEARWNLNGGSFVQDALVTVNNWQYSAFYQDLKPGLRHVCLARRQLPSGTWQTIVFRDYDQTEDDGHNTISLGICQADGSIHLSFDAHDTPLHYRRSIGDLTSNPSEAHWHVSSFGPVLDHLPGLEHLADSKIFLDTTYPRFLSLTKPAGALLLEYRIGVSGLGNDLIYVYSGRKEDRGRWLQRGVYLQGVQNNAYINGIDCDDDGVLHVTWTYRDYVPVTLEQSRQQAGPNGPENNHDLCYAYSPPEEDGTGPGLRWFNSAGELVGTSETDPILPSSRGIIAFDIPKHSGILNQEAQCVGPQGQVFALNRELVDSVEHWFIYSFIDKQWSKRALPVLPPSTTSARGKIFVARAAAAAATSSSSPSSSRQPQDVLIAMLPVHPDLEVLTIDLGSFVCETARAKTDGDEQLDGWTRAFVVPRAGGERGMEVLFDRHRVKDGVLSMFLGVLEEGTDGNTGHDGGTKKSLQVVDVALCADKYARVARSQDN